MKKLILKESELILLINSTVNSVLVEQQSVDCDDEMAFFYKNNPWDSSNTNILSPSTDDAEMVKRLKTIYPENATGADIVFNGCDDECWENYFNFYTSNGGSVAQLDICTARIPMVTVCGRPEGDALLRSEGEIDGWLDVEAAQKFVNQKLTDDGHPTGLGSGNWVAEWDKYFTIKEAPLYLDDIGCLVDCDTTCAEIDMYKPKIAAVSFDPNVIRNKRESKQWVDMLMFVYPDGFKSAQAPVKYMDAILKKLRLYPLAPGREEYCIKYISAWVKRPTRTYMDDQGVEFQAGPGFKTIQSFMFNLKCIPQGHFFHGQKSIQLRDIEHSDFKKGTWVGAQKKVEVKQHNPKNVSYSCEPGGCMQVGGTTGEFKTYSECENSCKQKTINKTSIDPTYPDSTIL